MNHPPQIRIPATYMRGGTSKGVFFKRDDLPEAAREPGRARDALLIRVIGSPDPVRGEVVAAFIVPARGFAPSAALADEIAQFVKQRLAAHEYPRKIRFLAELPMTITGKIRRVDLRQLDREGG